MDTPDQPASQDPEPQIVEPDGPSAEPTVAAGEPDDDGRTAMRWIAAGEDLDQFLRNVDRILEDQGIGYHVRGRNLQVVLEKLAQAVPNVQAGDCIAASLMNLAKVAKDAEL